MTDLTPEQLADLKAKAKAATPGPWRADRYPDGYTVHVAHSDLGSVAIAKVPGVAVEGTQANSDHIAAANPEAILRLIDMVERRDAWQLIETAPKDGTAILAYCPEDDPTIYCVAWVLSRHSGLGHWLEAGGEQYAWFTPTHWMPLPEPPIELSAATEPKP